MAKSIFQLAKLVRRLPRKARGLQHKVEKLNSSGDSPVVLDSVRNLLRRQAHLLELAKTTLPQVLAERRIGAPTIRCSLPLKKQRALGLLPAV